MEDATKQEIIENLCALRAGLSVISEENDKVAKAGVEAMNKIKRSGEEIKRQLAENKYISFSHLEKPHSESKLNESGLMCIYGRGLSEEDCRESFQLSKIEDSYYSHRAVANEYANSMKKRQKTYTIFWIISAICFVLAVVSFICIGVAAEFVVSGVVCIPATIVFFIIAAKKTSSTNKDKRRKYKEMSELNERILSERYAINAYPEWANEAKLIVSQMEQKAAPILDKCHALYSVLYDKYFLLLDERDWQYSDLIISYFETGRADSMKEALLLVEREVQTQRIEGAVGIASKHIYKTITQATVVIASQLDLISSQLFEMISLQCDQIDSTSRLVSSIDMNNALVAKANATSQKIMKDVAIIKSYKK